MITYPDESNFNELLREIGRNGIDKLEFFKGLMLHYPEADPN